MVDFIITDFESVRGGGNIVDTVPSAEDFIVDNCTISSVVSGEFVLTPGASLVGGIMLSASSTSITVGQSVVLSAVVVDTDGEPLEDMSVSFYRNGSSIGSDVTDSNGEAQLTVSTWSVGSFTVTAGAGGVSSNSVNVTVSKVASTISLSAVSSTISVGDSPQLTGTLSVGSGASVEIMQGSTVIDTVTTGTGGAFTYTGQATTATGTLTFKAVYDGDSTYDGVESSSVTITVSGGTPTVSSVSLTADKSVLSAYDSESATLTATVLDSSSNPMSGETVTFYNGSTSMGTATTNSSGVATKSYSSTGAGDVTFKATVSSVESSTVTVEDCIFYHPTAISYTGTSTSDTVYSLGYDQIADLSSTNFEFTWTFRQTSYGGDVCLGASSEFSVSPIKSNYRVYIGGTGTGKTRYGYRTTSTTNTEGSTSDAVSLNTDHNMKIVRNGNTFTYYFNGNQLGTKTVSFFGNYSMFGIHTVQWNKGTTTISNIKIKKVS